MTNPKGKCLILGLDGGTWRNLRPWSEGGVLPNLARLISNGTTGDLASVVPPVTAPAWVSFMTGKGPGKHGIYDFVKPSPGSPLGAEVISSRDVKDATLWTLAGDHGRKVGVVNVPITYPPSPVNGILVGDMLTPSIESDFTYPSSLRDELLQAIGGYTITVNWLLYRKHETDRLLGDLKSCSEQRHKALQYLMARGEWDLFVAVLTETDRLQHALWNLVEPGCHGGRESGDGTVPESVLDFYRHTDSVLGALCAAAGEDAFVFLLSDHGFAPLRRKFHVNNWLRQNGFLAMRSGKLCLLRVATLARRVLRKVSALTGVAELRRRWHAPQERRGIAAAWSLAQMVENSVDWKNTQAFARSFTQQGIHLNLRGREPNGQVLPGEEYENVRDTIISKLSEVKDPQTGEKVILSVNRREEVYSGPKVPAAPDIVFVMAGGYHADPFIGTELFGNTTWRTGSGMHTENGIFLAAGPGIRRGHLVEGASITDVAPTALYAMGLPVPDDMDGRVLTDIFEPSVLQQRPPHYVSSAGEQPAQGTDSAYSTADSEAVKERLRGLGYLG